MTHLDRFPSDFMYQLTARELANLKSQIVISSWGGARTRPYAFTKQGVAMLSSVLHSAPAIRVNVAIMHPFMKLRQMLETNRELAQKFSDPEQHVGKQDEEITAILEAIGQLMTPPEKPPREIGFRAREEPPGYRIRRRK